MNSIKRRFLPDADSLEAPDQHFVGHRDILTRSMARYHFVAPHIAGATLDIGCGRGYGYERIAPHTASFVGVDISYQFLQEARRIPGALGWVCASGAGLPFQDGTFQSILAFEVIEHIEQDSAFLEELRRLVQRDAFITLSTPNRKQFSGTAAKPFNLFHTREYTAEAFGTLLRQVFSSVQLFGQHEREGTKQQIDSTIDRIPKRWKYLLAPRAQDLLSITLRSPLTLEQCHFRTDALDAAHTLIAFCRP